MTAAARLDRIPSHNDLEVARLAHHALADVPAAGRFGDRKVFIASLWAKMCDVDAQTGGTLTCGATLEHFKAWLLRSRLFTADGTENGAHLVVLCRADLVAAMDPAQVAASETVTDGAVFHFVLDPRVAREEYAPRTRSLQSTISSSARGRVGRVGVSRRAA